MATNKQKKSVAIVTATSYQKRKKPRKHYVSCLYSELSKARECSAETVKC